MTEITAIDRRELRPAFEQDEVEVRRRNYLICCAVAILFMPAGASLEFFVYDLDRMLDFLPARLLSSVALMGIAWALWKVRSGPAVRFWGLMVGMPVIVSIAWMVHHTGGATSPYYAGLNLVLVGAALLMRWSYADSLIITGLTFLSYGIACLESDLRANFNIFFNNAYFLGVTGLMAVLGSALYTRIRLGEFILRRRLNEKSAEVEAANQRLGETVGELNQSKTELEKAISRLGESNTELNESKAKLEEANRQLEDGNARLEENNQKLRELDETKSRFFANVSHELRTPLTLLLAPIETLRSKGDRLDKSQKDDLLSTMHSNAMRLLKLINDLLDLVRLESGTIQIRRAPVAIEDFVRGIGTSATGVAEDKRIHLKTYCEAGLGRVMADSEKLERICLNLVFNALKFTPAGGSVTLSASREEDMLLLEVTDTGVGIAPENLKNLFTRFWQADTSSQRKYQGMGIGLSLVKEIAEAHGGGVSVQSQPSKGTTMSVRLPYEAAPEDAPEEEPETGPDGTPVITGKQEKEWISDLFRRAEMYPALTSLQATLRPVEVGLSARSKKPRLLIADDEPDMLRFLSTQLGENFDIIEAVDGIQAMEKADQFLPDIILSDMMMPEKDGLQVCRELRKRTTTRTIPVVLLTARADEKTKLDCLEAGASDFLGKPFSLTELSVRLKNLTDNHLYQRELLVQKQRLEAALEQIKETEAMLVRNEKLASLGRLSAGLIHEINNPLNYAKQALYFLRSTTEKLAESDRPDFEETLGDIENGVDRVARIISDLRGFSRNSSQVAGHFNVAQAVQTTLRFFAHAIKEGVEVDTRIPEHLEGMGDQNQFIQVLINLIQNALDAMEGKTYPEGVNRSLNIHAEESRDMISLHLRDNGPGIPEDIRNQVFDPFFTTKDVGAGMGLGLSICHQILAEHGGRILLDTRPGEYTEFTLEFPPAGAILQA